MNWVETKFRRPKTGDKPLIPRFRNGWVPLLHTYTAAQLRRSDTGSDWDIVAVARAPE